MTIQYTDQSKYLYHGKRLTVEEIAQGLKVDRKRVYGFLILLFRDNPMLKKKEIGKLLDDKQRNIRKESYYMINGKELSVRQILNWYGLPKRITTEALSSGETLDFVLYEERTLLKHRRDTPIVFLKKKYEEFLANPDQRIPARHYATLYAFYAFTGYPRSTEAELWIDEGNGPLSFCSVAWVTPEQRRLRFTARTSIKVTYKGKEHDIKELAVSKGIPLQKLKYRIKANWPESRWFE